MKLYVGNLSFETTEDRIREAFEPHGAVTTASIPKDRETGRPRGFGFVEMNDDAQARAAMAALDGSSLDGRSIVVNEAKARSGSR